MIVVFVKRWGKPMTTSTRGLMTLFALLFSGDENLGFLLAICGLK